MSSSHNIRLIKNYEWNQSNASHQSSACVAEWRYSSLKVLHANNNIYIARLYCPSTEDV